MDPNDDLDRELDDWVEELTARYRAAGLPFTEARRRALIDTEGVTQVKERVLEARRGRVTRYLSDHLRFDLRSAVRSVRVAPALIAAAVMTLALAIGVNLGMFGVISRALLSPPAHVPDPDRVYTVVVHGSGAQANAIRAGLSYPAFESLAAVSPELVAAFQRTSTSAMIDDEPRAVSAMLVSGNYLAAMGTSPAIGSRGLAHSDETAAPHAILSHAFWQSAFGGNPNIVGRRLSVGGIEYVVGGVMPTGFHGHVSTDVDMWLPFAAALRGTPGWDRDPYRSIGSALIRLSNGTAPTAAEAQLTGALGERVTLSSITGAGIAPTTTQVAWWLMAVSLLVFVVGLANAAILLSVRAARRRPELAVRVTLGASRGRLRTQLGIEALLLALTTTLLSFMVTSWFDEAIRKVIFPDLAARAEWPSRTIGAAAIAGLLSAAVAFGAALWGLRFRLWHGALLDTAPAVSRHRGVTMLLLVQSTLSVVLLAGAGMFARSLYNLAAQDFGIRIKDVVLVEFERGLGPGPRETEIFSEALPRVRALPGVELATVVDGLPFGGRNVPPISVPGHTTPPSVGGQLPFLNAATPEFLNILDVQIVQGRALTTEDERGAPVVIVNETMARLVWPGESAIGKCIRIGFDPDFDPATATGPPTPSAAVPCRAIVGVARDIRQRSVVPVDDEARLMQYYVPISQVPRPPFAAAGPRAHGILLRTGTDPDAIAPSIRRLVVGSRTDLPFMRVVAYRDLVDGQLRPWRTGATLLELFSALAMLVAAVGLYAVFTHSVAQRRREMAIRIAIGALPGSVLRMVLRDVARIAAIGAAAGGLAAVIGGRWIQSLLFETAPTDPIVLGAAAGAMLLVALAATWAPARAASRADPSLLLKVE